MKAKRLLKFYFSAGNLDSVLNAAITQTALAAGRDGYGNCEEYADKMCSLIYTKSRLAQVWARLDGIISAMTERDKCTLKLYAAMRRGPEESERKELHRAVVKFMRRAGGILADNKVYALLGAYCCLINPAPE